MFTAEDMASVPFGTWRCQAQGFKSLNIPFALNGFHLFAFLFIAPQKYDFFGIESKNHKYFIFLGNAFRFLYLFAAKVCACALSNSFV